MKKILAVCSNSIHKKMFTALQTKNKFLKYELKIALIHILCTDDSSLDNFGLNSLQELKENSRYLLYLLKTLTYVFFKGHNIISRKINMINPDIILLGNDTGHFERSIIRMARKKKITTMLLQDGLLFHRQKRGSFDKLYCSLFTFYQKNVARYIGGVKYGYGGCDFFLALGNCWVDFILNDGVSLYEQIHVVGSPYFELFIPIAKQLHSLNKPKTKPTKKLVITYFLTNFLTGLDDKKAHTLQLIEIEHMYKILKCRLNQNFQLILKIHPHDSLRNYSKLRLLGTQLKLTKKEPLESLFTKSQLCITNFSSVFVQAYFNNRPYLLSNIFLKKTKYSNFIVSLNQPTLSSLLEFDYLISRIQQDISFLSIKSDADKKMESIIDYNPKNSSSKRILDLINNIL